MLSEPSRGHVVFPSVLLFEPLHYISAPAAISYYHSGCNLLLVSRMLGHSNVATTMRYIGLHQDQMRNTIKATAKIDLANPNMTADRATVRREAGNAWGCLCSYPYDARGYGHGPAGTDDVVEGRPVGVTLRGRWRRSSAP